MKEDRYEEEIKNLSSKLKEVRLTCDLQAHVTHSLPVCHLLLPVFRLRAERRLQSVQ